MAYIEKDDDIVIRIPRKIYDKEIQLMIDGIQFKKVIVKSKATQKDIDKIVAEIKKERRPKIEALLEKAGIKK